MYLKVLETEAATRDVLWEKEFLEILQNSQKTPAPESLFAKKETLAQVFSRELCEIFKNTRFTEHLPSKHLS